MSDAPASLSDMSTPLDKSVTAALSKKGDAQIQAAQTAEAQAGMKKAALEDKAADVEDAGAKAIKDWSSKNPYPMPDLKPFTEKRPEPDPLKSFGSWASALGILAGALTKTPITASLRASAAAMSALRQNDLDGYEDRKKVWQENMEASIKRAEWEAKGYENALNIMRESTADGYAAVMAHAAAAGTSMEVAHILAEDPLKLAQYHESLQNSSIKGLEIQQKMQELGDTSAAGLRAAQAVAKANPGLKLDPAAPDTPTKIAALAKVNPEIKAQLTEAMQAEQGNADLRKHGKPAGGMSELSDDASVWWSQAMMLGIPMPSGLSRGGSTGRTVAKMMDAVSQSGISPGEYATMSAERKVDMASYLNLQKSADAAEAFEQNAVRNGESLKKLADRVDSTGVPAIESWIRAGRQATGDPAVSEFDAQMQIYRTEAARILSSPSMAGQLTDSARAEIADFAANNASASQVRRVVDLLARDFDNRQKTLQDEIDKVKERIKTGGRGEGSAPGKSAANPISVSSPDEARKLPSGSFIRIPSGEIRQVP